MANNDLLAAEFLKQVDAVVAQLAEMSEAGKIHDRAFREMGIAKLQQVTSRIEALVYRVGSQPYSESLRRITEAPANKYLYNRMPHLAGLLAGLRADLVAGYMRTAGELVRAELFGDFLETAAHLLDDQGLKDPAAVIAGSSLEAHLRQLCQRHGVDLTIEKKGDLVHRKADLLNAELVKAGAYEKLDQKNVTAWLDLRNKAAHGKYDEYEANQVALLIAGVRDFITRVPA